MTSGTTTSPVTVVIDASVVIALCAKEPDKFANAETKINEYAGTGCVFYAPGAVIAECLFVFCKKLSAGKITPAEHGSAVTNLITMMGQIQPPPTGDKALVKRGRKYGALSRVRARPTAYTSPWPRSCIRRRVPRSSLLTPP